MKADIFDIIRSSTVDGPGIRTAVFFKGCNLKCRWCHNPESQKAAPQMMFYKDKCKGCGKCKDVCKYELKDCDYCGRCELLCPADARKICGKKYGVSDIFDEVIKDKPYYDSSNGGVTFSGGECMLQIDFLCEILKKCKENGIHTAVDTAGCVPWEYFEKVMPYTDLFLYDVKCYSEDLHIKGTGVSNKLILNNLKKLSKKADIIIRIPVIPEFNYNMTEMKYISDFLKSINKIKTELLPYHKMGEHKYQALGRSYKSIAPLENTDITKFKDMF